MDLSNLEIFIFWLMLWLSLLASFALAIKTAGWIVSDLKSAGMKTRRSPVLRLLAELTLAAVIFAPIATLIILAFTQ
jgi:hypothetical protein